MSETRHPRETATLAAAVVASTLLAAGSHIQRRLFSEAKPARADRARELHSNLTGRGLSNTFLYIEVSC